MAQYRNVSKDTYQDAITGNVAKPDGLIDVPDDAVELYENHAIWKLVSSPKKTTSDKDQEQN